MFYAIYQGECDLKATGPILLLITAVLWGSTFAAQTAASAHVDPFTFNFSRNFIGALFLTGVIAVRKRNGHDKAPVAAGRVTKGFGYTRKTLVVAGVLCGVVLCAASFLQQLGISSYPEGTAISGRSGFVTAIYMIMVAVYGIFAGKKAHPMVFIAVAVAMIGMYFLCVPNGFGDIYVGDWLTLACALGYAAHIIVIDRYTQVDGVRLSRMQLLTAGCISLVCAFVFEHPQIANILAAIGPILVAGVLSDGVAYTFQIIAQKTTDPTVASVIMSLESAFAALAGLVFLGEMLGGIELFGCALVFAAVILSQVPTFIENTRRRNALREAAMK